MNDGERNQRVAAKFFSLTFEAEQRVARQLCTALDCWSGVFFSKLTFPNSKSTYKIQV